MTATLSVTGGARIGWTNATWPLATLTVSNGVLAVNALMLGTYTFAADEVVELEVFRSLPIIGRGIRIVHTRADYPKTIVFWCFGNPAKLLEDIKAAGFHPRAPRTSEPRRDGIPVRWTSVAAVVVLWNVLFLLDGSVPWNQPKPPGAFVFLAFAMVFAGSLALRKSPAVQAWVMKPGRPVQEIAPVLNILTVISAFLLIVFVFTS
jgi:hypothetical protein